jgi:hypothetical protein
VDIPLASKRRNTMAEKTGPSATEQVVTTGAGAIAGAVIGTALFPGVGTVLGYGAGGLIGAGVGALLGWGTPHAVHALTKE